MWRVTLRGLLAHKVRYALTALAVLLGVAFMAGTFVFTDTIKHTFDGLFTDVYGNTAADFERTLQEELTVDDTVIRGDPKLVDDFQLGLCSAAIDAADPAADYSAEPQPSGSRANLGHLGGTASATPTLPDLDRDGQVDGKDLLWIASAFASDRVYTPARYFPPADLDGNGKVDGDDLAFLAAYFGLACP